ncbi:MAG: hypothetical protein HY403_02070 [Elusimicrobia bacterium]|nr:hypothetical protein [Elusimicrobiota bacterium]
MFALRRRHFALASLGTLLGILIGECGLRCGGFIGAVADLQVASYVIADIWRHHSRALRLSGQPILSVDVLRKIYSFPRSLNPDDHFSRRFWGGEREFTTRPCPNPEMGYRINGTPEDFLPVYGVVVGDSYTEGAQVDDRETYVSRLSRISGKRFINLGVVGQGTGGDLARLKHSDFLKSTPRIIILQVSRNDLLDDLWLGANFPAYAHNFTLRPDDLPLRRWLFLYRVNVELSRRSLLYLLASWPFPRSWQSGFIRQSIREAGREMQRSNLSEFHALARSRGAKLLIVEYDTHIRQDYGWPPDSLPGVSVIQLKIGANETVRFDGHWNRAGHNRAAELIGERLRELGWLRL